MSAFWPWLTRTLTEATMHALRLAIVTLALSFAVIGTAWGNAADLADADSTAPVPEPGTLVLLLTGIGAGATVFIRRRK